MESPTFERAGKTPPAIVVKWLEVSLASAAIWTTAAGVLNYLFGQPAGHLTASFVVLAWLNILALLAAGVLIIVLRMERGRLLAGVGLGLGYSIFTGLSLFVLVRDVLATWGGII